MGKIAAIQMCSSHIVEENLSMADKLIFEAAQQGAQLIVLPEMFALIGKDESDKLAIKEPIGQGKIQTFLSDLARKNKIWLVAGTIPIATENVQKVRAACLVFDNQGSLKARYDKIHLFDVTITQNERYQESATIEAGHTPVVLDTPVGKLGLAVCYDVRFPELFRYLSNLGAELIALPSAFTLKTGAAHWELLTRSRAVENFCYVIGACQGGTHTNGRKTYGRSLIVDPWGSILAKKDDDKPGIIYADVDLDHLQTIRQAIPALKHQKIFFDLSRLKA